MNRPLQPPAGKYTMISDLENLPEVGNLSGVIPEASANPSMPSSDSIKKHIRENSKAYQESGMGNQLPPPQPIQIVTKEPEPISYVPNPLYDINCLQISMHVRDCPVCSSIYKCDRTMQNFIIFILIVICVVLLKKLMDARAI